MRNLYSLIAVLPVISGACGGSDGPSGPGSNTPDPSAVCGNGAIEGDEECDEGGVLPTATCDSECRLICGNGVVDDGEVCDTGIAEGQPGGCSTSCDDGESCTSDVLLESSCLAECASAPITANIEGDGCCLPDAINLDDPDCPAVCDNGYIEAGESCDDGEGTPRRCPQAFECDDDLSCTRDSVANSGTCQAACAHEDITEATDDDGCCLAGSPDSDCPDPGLCGNSVVDDGEECDVNATGEDACPTECPDDGDACTRDIVDQAGTCLDQCVRSEITEPEDGDGCCPHGAHANNDSDCTPECGNRVTEPGEECDDANDDDPEDGCHECGLPPTALRVTQLELRDPHTFFEVGQCTDVTPAVNEAVKILLEGDGNEDGFVDLSPTLVFRPLAQGNSQTPVELAFAQCTAPVEETSCTPGALPPIASTATSQQDGTCLDILPDTVHPEFDPPTPSSSPCFASAAETLTLDLAGIAITLTDAQIAGTYLGTPATELRNGLVRGFLSEEVADNIIIPEDVVLVGGERLSALLAGGTDNCAEHDDRDQHKGETGWWFYLNFSAEVVPWSDV